MIRFASHQADLFAPIWLIWLLAFVAIELLAIWLYRKHPTDTHKGATLSELVWRTFKRYWWTLVILVVFLAVLGTHFLFEI